MTSERTRQMVTIALMMAVEIVLTRVLSFEIPIIRISFGFLPIAILGYLYGPFYAGIASALANIIGVTLFAPFAPFPGFVLTAFLMGLVYGLFLHKQGKSLVRTILAVLVVTIVLQLGLDAVWIQMLHGYGFLATFPPRILRTVVMIPVQIVLIRGVIRILPYIIIRRNLA